MRSKENKLRILLFKIFDFKPFSGDHGHPSGDNLVLLLFLRSKNNNKHARAKPLIVPQRGTMVFRRRLKIEDFKEQYAPLLSLAG